mgnify:CR=1
RKKINTNTVIGIFQFILLLLFAQGRADYYVSPILLTYVGIDNIEAIVNKNNFVKTKKNAEQIASKNALEI